jgi:hypothetical protein
MEDSITNSTLVIWAQKWYFVFKIVLKAQLFWEGHKNLYLSSGPCKSYWQDSIRATYKMKKKCQMEVSVSNLTLVICAQKLYFDYKIVLKVQLFWEGNKNLYLSSGPCKLYWQDRIRATYNMKINAKWRTQLPIQP